MSTAKDLRITIPEDDYVLECLVNTLDTIELLKQLWIKKYPTSPDNPYFTPMLNLFGEYIAKLPFHLRHIFQIDKIRDDVINEKEVYEIKTNEINLKTELFCFSGEVKDDEKWLVDGGERLENITRKLFKKFTKFRGINKEKKNLIVDMSNNMMYGTGEQVYFVVLRDYIEDYVNMFQLICYLLISHKCDNLTYLNLSNNYLAYSVSIELLIDIKKTCSNVVVDLTGNYFRDTEYNSFDWIITDW